MRVRDEVDDELRFHLEARTAELMAGGMDRAAAAHEARRQFGSLGEARRAMGRRTARRRLRQRIAAVLADLVQDVRFVLRSVRSSPGVWAAAVLSLAIGMAAISTMWTTLDRLHLRPLPYDPDRRLVFVGTTEDGRGRAMGWVAPGDYLDLRASVRSVELAAYRDGGGNLGGDPPEWVAIRFVAPDFLSVVGVEPRLGRDFQMADANPGRVAILADELWKRSFGADRDVLGRTISVDGAAVTVVGVLPPGFAFGQGRPDLLMPLDVADDGDRAATTLSLVGRMGSTAGVDGVRTELEAIARDIARRMPATHDGRSFTAEGVVEALNAGPVVAQGLGGSVAAAVLVLLIACANVSNLLLARGMDRADELALRQALGAARWRIGRQLITEASLLAVVGGLFGIGVSAWGIRGIALMAPDMPRAGELALDMRSAAICVAIALGTVLLFGLIPALRTLAAGDRSALSGGTRGGASGARSRLRSGLVAFELGLSVVLLATTALMVRTVHDVRAVETGFDAEEVWTARMTLPEAAYPDEASVLAGILQIHERLRGLPGVEVAGLGVGLPGWGWRNLLYRTSAAETDANAPRVLTRIVQPSYLRAVGLTVRRGRTLMAADDGEAQAVGLVNESFARRLWGRDDPLGRTLEVEGRTVSVVGVMPDVRELGAGSEPRAALYLPLAQWPDRFLSVVLRMEAGPPPPGEVQKVTRGLDGDVAVRELGPLERLLLASTHQVGALAKLVGVLGLAALALATAGVYATTSYGVSRREAEIGVRMALGADRSSVLAMVFKGAMIASAVGLAVGLPLAWAAGRALSSYVVGAATADPGPYVAVSLLLAVVTLLAAWLPARRASGIDPMRALRED